MGIPGRCLTYALVGAALVASGSNTRAENDPVKSFELVGTATWDRILAALPVAAGGQGVSHFAGTAQMTHLGRVQQSGDLHLGLPNAQGIAEGAGSVTLIAANGDKLFFNYVGQLDSTTGVGTGTIEITGGTGRFTNASGSGSFVAHIFNLLGTNNHMDVEVVGTLRY